MDFLVLLIEAVPTITIKELNTTLRDIWPRKPIVCDTTIARVIDGALITLKKCDNVPHDRNSPDVKEARVQFAHYMYERGLQRHRVYVDETGYNLHTKRTYGRAARGERVVRTVGGQRGGNTTLIAAISDRGGLIYSEIHTSSVTQEVFHHFLASLEVILDAEDAVVIMDNAPCHRRANDSMINHQVKYLPPHSPFLNPIENCFSVLKATLKQHLNNIAEGCDTAAARRLGQTLKAYREGKLRGAMEDSLIVLTPQITQANYQHSNTFLMKCLHREDIWA